MWQLGVVATGVISAVAQAIGKKQTAHMSAFQSGLVRDLSTWGMVIVMYLGRGEVRIEWASLIFVILGLMESVSMAAYYSAQREQMAATAVFSYPFSQLLIIIGSGIVFSEWHYFDPRQWQGILNSGMVVGLLLMMVGFQGRSEKKRIGWSTKLILSSLVIVSSNLLAKWGVTSAGYSPTEYMFWEYLGIVMGGIIFVYGRGLKLDMAKSDWAWGILQGLLFGAGALWYVGLLSAHPLSIASIIRRVVIVILTTFFGLFGFGERRTLSTQQIWKLVVGLLLFGTVLLVNR